MLGFLDSGQKHSTFIDTALDLMDDASYAATLRRVWQDARDGKHGEAMEEVLDSAALQWPELYSGSWGAAAGGDARRSRRAALLRGLRLAGDGRGHGA